MFIWWGHCRSGSLKVRELEDNLKKKCCCCCLFVYLFVFDKPLNIILEDECLDFKYEFCSGSATQDIGGFGNSKILDTTKA